MSTRLEKEVWALDRCSGCGNCVALCAKGMLSWGADESPILERREKALGLSHTILDSCSFCPKFCEKACPRLDEASSPLEPWRALSVRTRGIVQSGEPNDVIKHLLVAALAADLIDGAILGDTDLWTLKPVTRIATSVGDVIDTLGTSYLWTASLSVLNEAIFDRNLRSLAVVGTPCVSQAIRKVRSATEDRLNPYRQALRLNIAVFCTGVYRPELVNGFLPDWLGLVPSSIKRLEATPRDDVLTAVLWDGSTRTISLTEVEQFTRHGCARCDDYLGASADLAVGTIGAARGFSTLIIRSPAGELCLRVALQAGLIEASDGVDTAALVRAQEEKEKRRRAQEFDKLMIMMLDALAEPRRRAEIKQAFVRLYGAKRSPEVRREEGNCYVTCNQC